MKTLKRTITAVVLLLLGSVVQAQQAPMFTHYMYNTLSVNPAYAGSRDALTITTLNRSQWVGFKGAPNTQTLTLHTPIISKNIGLGLSLLNDKIGPVTNQSVFADFAYRIAMSRKSKLAFGLSAGINIFQANLDKLELDNQNDPSFQNNIDNHITPNFGFGMYYSRERFYAGVSVPNILENNYSDLSSGTDNMIGGKEQKHFYLISGAMIKLNDNVDFKPSTLVKVTAAAPIQVDLTALFVIAKKLELGMMYRTNDAVGALIGFNILKQLHLGYSFDFSYGVETTRYNQGSHELMLRYDFIFAHKNQIQSPRYF